MKEKEDLQPVFPEGYSHVGKSLKELQGKIEAIDQEIESLPESTGPTLRFQPPSYKNPSDHDAREREIARLKVEQTKLKTDFKNALDKELESTEPKLATKVKGIVDYQLSDNPHKNLSPQKSKSQDTIDKDNYSAFDKTESLHFNRFTVPVENKAQELSLDEMGDRFLSMLSYPEDTPYGETEKDMTLENPEPDFEKD